jgi:hypothetical protein
MHEKAWQEAVLDDGRCRILAERGAFCGDRAECSACGTDCSTECWDEWSWCPYCGREVADVELVPFGTLPHMVEAD